MINEVFKSLNESVKKRNSPESFIPLDSTPVKDIMHRGYIRSTGVPIKYDFIPDGKHQNSGKHVYHYKNKSTRGVVEIDHRISPSQSGHETQSKINFELTGDKPEGTDVQFYRDFILPSVMHHFKTHKPEIINFTPSVIYSDDLIRRFGDGFESKETESPDGISRIAKKKLDQKITRMISHLRKTLNRNRETE
jgi:hypothetical protein